MPFGAAGAIWRGATPPLTLTYTGPVSGTVVFTAGAVATFTTPGDYTFTWNQPGTVAALLVAGGGYGAGGHTDPQSGGDLRGGGGGAGGFGEWAAVPVSGSMSARVGNVHDYTTFAGYTLNAGGNGGAGNYPTGTGGETVSYASGGGGGAGRDTAGARGEGGPAPYGNPGAAGVANPSGAANGGAGGGASTTAQNQTGGNGHVSVYFGGQYAAGGSAGGGHGASNGGRYGDGGDALHIGGGIAAQPGLIQLKLA